MNWPWKHREAEAEARAQEAAAELARVEARRPVVEQVNRSLVRETVEINGWTERAKRAFS